LSAFGYFGFVSEQQKKEEKKYKTRGLSLFLGLTFRSVVCFRFERKPDEMKEKEE
jgi:hypothetical protein